MPLRLAVPQFCQAERRHAPYFQRLSVLLLIITGLCPNVVPLPGLLPPRLLSRLVCRTPP